MRKNKKGKASFFLQAYLPSIESAMLIWITKALLTHQTGLWWFHFYWSDIHREGDAGIRPSKFPLSVTWKNFSV